VVEYSPRHITPITVICRGAHPKWVFPAFVCATTNILPTTIHAGDEILRDMVNRSCGGRFGGRFGRS